MKNSSKIIDNKEILVVWLGLAFSCINSITLLISMIGLLVYLRQGVSGAIKSLILISIRQVFNNRSFVSMSSVQTIKWILIFLFLVYIFLSNNIDFKSDYNYSKFRIVSALLTLFIFTASIFSLMNSSYPITALFKLFSFFLVFLGIMIGVKNTMCQVDYLNYILMVLSAVMIFSLIVFPFNNFRTINKSFQGILNHPNMMGIFVDIYLVCAISHLAQKKILYVILLLSFLLLINTDSRTCVITFSFVIILSLKKIIPKNNRALFVFVFFAVILGVVFFFNAQIGEIISEFIYKGHEDKSLLYSREYQLDMLWGKFLHHPLFGSGFMVPYSEGVTIWTLNMNLPYEPGNLILSVLADCGIIGFVLFILLILSIFIMGEKNNAYLFVFVIIINLGELVLFSVNNMSMLLYVVLAVYLFEKNKVVNNNCQKSLS